MFQPNISILKTIDNINGYTYRDVLANLYPMYKDSCYMFLLVLAILMHIDNFCGLLFRLVLDIL